MLSFDCDYTTGAHEKILERLISTNYEALPGYGTDKYCESAAKKIISACDKSDAQVHFLVGGTQTNSIIRASLLGLSEGVIAASTGHVAVHEAGAIEYTGHKVLTLPSHAGKIDADELDRYVSDFYADESYVHMVSPGMVYISHPTEYGTLYTKDELTAIKNACQKHSLP